MNEETNAPKIICCKKCKRTAPLGTHGWIHARRKNLLNGDYITRCPEHVNDSVRKSVGLPITYQSDTDYETQQKIIVKGMFRKLRKLMRIAKNN